jgi:hypothetical protein
LRLKVSLNYTILGHNPELIQHLVVVNAVPIGTIEPRRVNFEMSRVRSLGPTARQFSVRVLTAKYCD